MDASSFGLKVVPIGQLVLHELTDEQRVKKLARVIQWDGCLRDPVIVTEGKHKEHLVVLDGATRTTAMKEIGQSCIAVQVVDYKSDEIELHRWCHIIPHYFSEKVLKEELRKVVGSSFYEADKEKAKKLLDEGKIACYFITDGHAIAIENAATEPQNIDRVSAIVSLYLGKERIQRVRYPDIDKFRKGLAFVPPIYTKKQLIDCALNLKKLVPPGVTRHVVPGRVIGLHVDLTLLKSKIPLKDKNVLLDEIINEKIELNRFRYYPESVYAFNG